MIVVCRFCGGCRTSQPRRSAVRLVGACLVHLIPEGGYVRKGSAEYIALVAGSTPYPKKKNNDKKVVMFPTLNKLRA